MAASRTVFCKTLQCSAQTFRCSAVTLSRVARRFASVKAQSIVYSEFGDPNKVLRLDFVDRDAIGPSTVGVQMVAAPINPADINQIQGSYGIRPSLPAVGGREGFGQVVKAGKDVKDLKEGDFVILAESFGSWSRYNVLTEDQLIKIPDYLTLEMAATMSVNPCTAYRMLKDFETLLPGDTVIQNGGNSGVGRAVIQLAAAWGLKTINIVRDRPNLDELKKELTDLGATHIVTDEFCRSSEMAKMMKELPKPKLGLNCVGGRSATDVAKHLGFQGTIVTYGGMSKKPFLVPAGMLIFNDIRVRGFWITGWNNLKKTSERTSMIEDICQMHKDGRFSPPPCTKHPLEEFGTAVSAAMAPYSSSKQLLMCKHD